MLSNRTKDIVIVALADKRAGQELSDAVDAGANAAAPESANVAELGALAPVGAVDVADAGPADVALSADVDSRLSDVQSKIDELIAALVAAGLMEAP